MEIELLKAQREESKLKDASLIELSNSVKILKSDQLKIMNENNRLITKCNKYESINQILSTENHVCMSLLAAARARGADISLSRSQAM